MEPLNVDTIRRFVHTRLLGQVVHYWAEVDSTNAALLRLTKEGALEGTVVVADAQTAGRGRIGKPWFSPPGVNLHLSVLLKPPLQIGEARLLTLIGSLAIADAIEAQGVKTQVKWPNDVLVADKKIAGVLAEVQAHDGRVEHLILGMGVNLNIDRPTMDRLFGDAAPGATSLRETLGHEVDRASFAAVLLESLEKRYFDFLSAGKRPLLKEWRNRSFLGRRVSVREEDMHVEGIAMDLDDEGCLLVTLDDGSSVHVREGEVVPLTKTEE
ncbi:MAG: biotin--[acetyl-CoA-carboxylase] ligase [Deltaproteobacteria bacterium]|nr:biotin--[acetyl-CoA-carboxylase] ligase [Deltaproteobacteria bacterium]